MNDSNNIIKQKKGLNRNIIDKFYTKLNIAEQCIKLVKKYINISENDLIIEPSAGNGAFIEYIKRLSQNYKFYDLEPENNEIYKKDLLEKSFLVNNIESDVPCIFQIWQFKNEYRKEITKQIPIYFKFVDKNNNPDISFRRVGVNAGTIMKEINDKSSQSHYFIKFTNNNTIDDNIKNLELLKFNFNNTVGPKSISKQELISEFNKLIG